MNLRQNPFKCNMGDTLVLTAKENPTTGYQWIFNKEAQDSNNPFYTIKDEYQRDPAPEELMGVGGKRVITLSMLRRGSTRFEMVRDRSWLFEGFTGNLDDKYIPPEHHNIKITIQ